MNPLLALCLFFIGLPAVLIVALQMLRRWHKIRHRLEAVFKAFLLVCACLAIFTTVGIVLSVLFEAIRFFNVVPLGEFLFGLNWSPQTAIREDQVGSSGAFGAVQPPPPPSPAQHRRSGRGN